MGRRRRRAEGVHGLLSFVGQNGRRWKRNKAMPRPAPLKTVLHALGNDLPLLLAAALLGVTMLAGLIVGPAPDAAPEASLATVTVY
jgi:CDP-diglyceride synthetase